MALSIIEIAYGAVVIAALALFSLGKPRELARQAPSAAAPAPPAGASQTVSARTAETVTARADGSTVTVGGIMLHSVSVELPSSDRVFPGGASADAINNTCLACHSAGMVLTQPTFSAATWQAEVEKMRDVYKAPVAAADVRAIVDYLDSLGKGQ
jgi:hypothetical protein